MSLDGNELRLVVTREPGHQTIHAYGDLGAAGGRALRALADHIAEGPDRFVLLDLADVVTADLDGLRALSAVRSGLDRVGVTLTITNPVLAAYPTDWQPVPLSAAGTRRAVSAIRRPR